MMSQECRNTLKQGRYIPRKVIGTGTYGHVLRCWDTHSEREVAVKVAHKAPAYRRSALNESNVLQMLSSSPSCKVVKLIETFDEDGRIHIATELLYKNLYEVICERGYKGFSLEELRHLGKNILSALAELHRRGYMHCDIKPENTMLPRHDSMDVRVIDFGSVRKLEENTYFDVQSLWYRAPEVICGVEYTPQIDAWSCGCLFAELVTGSPLFPGDSPQQQLTMIIETLGHPSYEALNAGKYSATLDFAAVYSGDFDSKFCRHIGAGEDAQRFLDLLQGLLNPDENYRLTVEDALSHPFFTQEAWPGRGYRGQSSRSNSFTSSMIGGLSAASDSVVSTPERTCSKDTEVISPLLYPTTLGPVPIGEDI